MPSNLPPRRSVLRRIVRVVDEAFQALGALALVIAIAAWTVAILSMFGGSP